MSFRGINTTVIQIRRQVFTEVARMAYANVKGEQANHLMRKIPYTIIPGEEGKLRKDIFLERAIVEERVRSPSSWLIVGGTMPFLMARILAIDSTAPAAPSK